MLLRIGIVRAVSTRSSGLLPAELSARGDTQGAMPVDAGYRALPASSEQGCAPSTCSRETGPCGRCLCETVPV
jgi:hypothetical protein